MIHRIVSKPQSVPGSDIDWQDCSEQRPLEAVSRDALKFPVLVLPGLEREFRQKGVILPFPNPVAFVMSLSLQTSVPSLAGKESLC